MRRSVLRIGLVACCAKKGAVPCAAKDLYLSPLFTKSRAWVERHCDRWLILSAEHGLLAPETVIAPYERTLNRMNATDRRAWGDRVRQQFESVAGSRFVALAGVRYCEPLVALDLERPMAGLGIGQQLAWLSHARKATTF